MALDSPIISIEEMLARGDRLLRLRTAADLLGKHTDTLKRKAKRGELTLVKTSSRTYDVWLSELARWVKTCDGLTVARPTAEASRAARERMRWVRNGGAA